MQLAFVPREQFQSLGCFERRNQIHYRSKNADRVARFFQARRAAGFQQAGKTRGLLRPNRKRQAIAGNRGGINPRSA